MPQQRRASNRLTLVQVFIGVGAVPSGLILMAEPLGSPNFLPLSLLQTTPFPDYTIPGALLFAVNGVGSLAGATLARRHHPAAPAVGMALGAFLIGWISAQVYWFKTVHWLHLVYFLLGAAEFTLSLWLWLLARRKRV